LDFLGEEDTRLNVGIAAVTPIIDALDVIKGEELAKRRKEYLKALRRKDRSSVSMD